MSGILLAIGGLGLFLVGMQVLTDGLRGLAGSALRRWLVRTTKTPLSGALTGALTTAIIQSSSATTITAIGFVGAGLLTFSHALGIIFGANIGTTITGWMVAIIGFKLHLTEIVMPLVLVGALLKLFGHGRIAHSGWALAGFSLLFIGIGALQEGMTTFEGLLTPQSFPDDTLLGRAQLVLLGILITVVTQSSSAGVATALVAIGAGAISFSQAAALVIGMDVGTTFTAAVATLGGSVASRRTGYAHVIYNILTGIMAFALLTPYTAIASNMANLTTAEDAQIALVAFHTSFNVLGVLLVIGFTDQFARLIRRLVPEQGPQLQNRLDNRLLQEPEAALDAAEGTAREIASTLFTVLQWQLNAGEIKRQPPATLASIRDAIDATYNFVSQIQSPMNDRGALTRHQTLFHILDHLARLHHRCMQTRRVQSLPQNRDLIELASNLSEAIASWQKEPLHTPRGTDEANSLPTIRHQIKQVRHKFRSQMFEDVASGKVSNDDAQAFVDSLRWLHRASYHLWRITLHFEELMSSGTAKANTGVGHLVDTSDEDDD